MKLSVITINYNNAAGLEDTIRSVINQSFKDFEYIVIDGNSTDRSTDIIKSHCDHISYWISEPDSGIYNAMNKGIEKSRGEYILFINSGDTIYGKDVLSEVFNLSPNADLIYGNLQRVYPDGHTDIVDTPEQVSVRYMFKNTIPHPACFIRKELFNKYGTYREDLKVVSDWAFFLKVISSDQTTTKHIPLIISSFKMDGLSNNTDMLIKIESDRVIKEYFPPEVLKKYPDPGLSSANQDIRPNIKRGKHILSRIFTISFWDEVIHRRRYHALIRIFNKTVRQQEKDPLSIPIIIISYNRLEDLKKLVSFLLIRGHKQIIIADNQSTYPPLLKYYETIKDKVTIRIMDQNYGHLVLWQNQNLFKEYGKGYYIVTDSDIIPNNKLPKDYINHMISILNRHREITKTGFALRIDDIPDHYAQKQYVLDWEKQFWEKPLGNDMYYARLDTTFALYAPQYRYFYDTFYDAIRIAGNFTAQHGGWYMDSRNPTDEEKYYIRTASSSSSWNTDEKGVFTNELYIK